MKIDYVAAFEKYNTRFDRALGEKPVGTYAKFNKHMIKRLDREEFRERLDTYVQLHAACKRMLDGGSTISDALVHDFEEAAAWVAVEAPDIYAMFKGEIGDPREAAPIEGDDATDPGQ
ncbi:MAG TPA: hypothetical protein RMH99_02780 [Sandaracinaceae bacterium LLY-WYZ-13_1]|nr:hypothetical protein [Sandaracinaceae bacterium LLY-WYZ-13_1]